MANSVVEICNFALASLGEVPISSLDQQSKSARVCKLFWGHVLEETLSKHHWGFAAARRSLARLDVDSVGPWTYSFSMPADCLKARFIETASGDQSEEFRVEDGVLMANVDAPVLVYTRRVEDPTRFSPEFVTALSRRLEMELAVSVSGSMSKKETAVKLFNLAIDDAKNMDRRADRSQERIKLEDPWISCRG